MNKFFKVKVAAAVCALGLSLAVNAATTSTTVNVTANVISTCNMQASSTDVAFGSVAAFLASPLGAVGQVSLQCNKGATVSVDVSTGGNYGSGQSGSMRAMKSGSDYVSYHIYQPSGLTSASAGTCGTSGTEWGSGVSGGSALSVSSIYSASGGTRNINLCGTVDAAPAGGYAVGTYSDVVTVTATY
jgi:spore coat protein U-like protein